MAGAGLNWGIQAGMAANLLKDAGMVGVNVVRSGLQDAAEVAAEEAVSTGCFVAGTPVHVLSSPLLASAVSTVGHGKSNKGKIPEPKEVVVPIEKLHAGDYVLSRDVRTGRTDWKRVERTTLRKVGLVLTVSLSDAKTGQVVEQITATREHPFYVRGKGFVPAGGLATGNAIVTRAGPGLVVKQIVWHRRTEGYAVYNCVVENSHTYFVGNVNGGVWVHNNENCFSKLPLDPTPYDKNPLASPLSEETEAGNYVYVRDTDGVVHVAPDGPHVHPTVLGGGQAATGAGTMTIGPDGVVTSVDNISGTFQFGSETLDDVVKSIQAQGLQIGSGAIRPFRW